MAIASPSARRIAILSSCGVVRHRRRIMNTRDQKATLHDQDNALEERIRAEIRLLLQQRTELARMEKQAALKERTMRVAHDIRNPLATIQAVCGSLILEAENSDQRDRLEVISNQVNELVSRLAGVVDGSRDLDEGPTLVDVGDLARSLVNLVRYQTREDLVFHLNFGAELRCRLPESGLTRSLYHLLWNAAEALSDRPGGEIHVTCLRNGTQLEIHVVDNGPGLPSELLEKGVRGLTTTRAGSGFGLSTVQRFVEGLSGRLAFRNREGAGAQVSMLLPADCCDLFP